MRCSASFDLLHNEVYGKLIPEGLSCSGLDRFVSEKSDVRLITGGGIRTETEYLGARAGEFFKVVLRRRIRLESRSRNRLAIAYESRNTADGSYTSSEGVDVRVRMSRQCSGASYTTGCRRSKKLPPREILLHSDDPLVLHNDHFVNIINRSQNATAITLQFCGIAKCGRILYVIRKLYDDSVHRRVLNEPG